MLISAVLGWFTWFCYMCMIDVAGGYFRLFNLFGVAAYAYDKALW